MVGKGREKNCDMRYFAKKTLKSGFSEAGGEGDEEFEVDAGHGAGEDGEVVFVEEVVDGEFELDVDGAEGEGLVQGDVAHEVAG